MNIRTYSVCILMSAAAFAATAQQQASPNEAASQPQWVLEIPENVSVDSSDAGNAADFNARIEKLTLAASSNTSIILSCQMINQDGQLRDSRLNVGFDLD
ncbi:MAG: hypothetical protein AAGB16_00890, partial [Pseudomonadota bacterium]